ncbi:MAG: hypothetical protein M5U17_17325 [Ignavibacterium sp.]|nr:hypothetical protein [Ignavibacterium sp.]
MILTISETEKTRNNFIADNTLEFIEKLGGQDVLFKPRLKGYSFIPDLCADLSIGDSLFEIKTGKQNFKSSDSKTASLFTSL